MMCTAMYAGGASPNIRVTFEREGEAPSHYVIAPDAQVVSAENPLPYPVSELLPDFRTAIEAMSDDFGVTP